MQAAGTEVQAGVIEVQAGVTEVQAGLSCRGVLRGHWGTHSPGSVHPSRAAGAGELAALSPQETSFNLTLRWADAAPGLPIPELPLALPAAEPCTCTQSLAVTDCTGTGIAYW